MNRWALLLATPALGPWSKGFICIVKSTVVVEGDVVTVGGKP